MWHISHRADKRALPLADRHYNRQKVGSPQFVPPGRCVVLVTVPIDAFWVTSWPFAQYVKHRWGGAWVCSAFRRENRDGPVASEMIRAAVAATRWVWPDTPQLGMVTFLDRRHVRPVMVRGRPTYGRTWALAGFEPDGETKGGLLAFRLPPGSMPPPEAPLGASLQLAPGASPRPTEDGR
jgi:hypothetical protein